MSGGPDIQQIATDAGVALLAGLVVALLLGSLTIAGVINLPLAIVVLAIAWLVAIGGTFLLPHIWNPSPRDRWIFGSVFGAVLIGVGALEIVLQPSSANHYARFQIEEVMPLEIEAENVWYINYVGYNRGSEPLFGLRRFWSYEITHSALTVDLENQHIQSFQARQGKLAPVSGGSSKIYPGEKAVTTIEVSNGRETQRLVYSGDAFLYIYVRFVYQDDFLPDNTVWVTERCVFVAHDHNVHVCSTHNEIHKQKL